MRISDWSSDVCSSDLRLRDPQTWLRAAKGGVSIGKFISGLRKVSSNSSQNENGLADRIFAVLPPSATVILASGDATAIAFADAARTPGWAGTTNGTATRQSAPPSGGKRGYMAWGTRGGRYS